MARAISPSVEIGALSAPSILIPVVSMAHGIVVRPTIIHHPLDTASFHQLPDLPQTVSDDPLAQDTLSNEKS